MPLILQGNWTINVLVKNPISLPQRFTVSNATIGNGTYNGFVGAAPVTVSGASWSLNIQANEDYDLNGAWINSSVRKTDTREEGGYFVFEVESEDLIQDNSWDDLVLQFKKQIPVVVTPPTPVVPPTPVIPVPVPPTVTPPTAPPLPEPEPLVQGKVYTKFNLEDMLPRQTYTVQEGIWYEGSGSLYSFFTASNYTHTSSLLSVYNKLDGSCGNKRMFDVSYGHIDGSGSKDLGGNDYNTLSNAIYTQYANMCLPNGERQFNIGSKKIKHFYAVSIAKSQYIDELDERLFELDLHTLSGSYVPNDIHTGSNVKPFPNGNIIKLISDSTLATVPETYYYSGSRNYNYIVSGSLEDGIYSPTNPKVYGLILKKHGTLLLDADILDQSASFGTVTSSDAHGDNPMKLFTSVSASALYTDATGDRFGFVARKTKYLYNDTYFVRVKNFDYNHSNNPTWSTGSNQDLLPEFMNNNPQTYVTEIGLYDDKYQLIAVGKVQRPKKKNYKTEGMYTVTLKY